MQAITKRPWFGPRKYLGWGWSPTTWQGALVSVVFVLALLANSGIFRHGITGTLVLLALFGVVVALTSGRPGGPTAFRRERPRS